MPRLEVAGQHVLRLIEKQTDHNLRNRAVVAIEWLRSNMHPGRQGDDLTYEVFSMKGRPNYIKVINFEGASVAFKVTVDHPRLVLVDLLWDESND